MLLQRDYGDAESSEDGSCNWRQMTADIEKMLRRAKVYPWEEKPKKWSFGMSWCLVPEWCEEEIGRDFNAEARED